MTKENTFKNGGFPPIKYSKPNTSKSSDDPKKPQKERFFSNAARNDISIREILTTKSANKPIIVVEPKEEQLDIVDY